jgi:hypothetical protein
LHFLFDIHLLTRDKLDNQQLVLTTTERDFMQTTHKGYANAASVCEAAWPEDLIDY